MTPVRIPPTLRTATAGTKLVDVDGTTVQEVVEHGAHGVAVDLDLACAADLVAERRGDADGRHACTGPAQNST